MNFEVVILIKNFTQHFTNFFIKPLFIQKICFKVSISVSSDYVDKSNYYFAIPKVSFIKQESNLFISL